MGLLENAKARLGPAKEKMSHVAREQGGKVRHGIDKAARAVDERTKGKYSDKIHAGTDKAKHAVDRLAHKGGHGHGPGTPGTDAPMPPTPPKGPPPAS